jgi:hypothetical protein
MMRKHPVALFDSHWAQARAYVASVNDDSEMMARPAAAGVAYEAHYE